MATGWAVDLPLVVTFDGATVGDTTGTTDMMSASFGAGRGDWFDTIAPSSGNFTFTGDESIFGIPGRPGDLVGQAVVVSLDGVTLWTGVVDTAVVDEAVGPIYTTTVTAMDQVAQLGQAQLADENLSGPDSILNQIPDVFGFAGLTAVVEPLPTGDDTGFATLDAINPLSGSVLDWLQQAERDSNAWIAPAADGAIKVQQRGHFADYGDRVISDYYHTSSPPVLDSHWRMDETSGNLTDSGPGGITGTKAGTPTYSQDGPWGSPGPDAIAFQEADATDEYTFGDVYDITGNFAMSCWVYWASGGTGTIASKNEAGPHGWAWDITSADLLRFRAWTSGAVVIVSLSSNATIPTNTWTHVAVARSSNTWALFINGVQDNSTTAAGAMPNTTAVFRIGSFRGSSEWFGGRICQFSVWDGNSINEAILNSLIYLDRLELTGDLAPFSWTETASITTVINHWLFRQFAALTEYSDAGSISDYGDHSFEHESDALSALDDVYSAENRTALADPRVTVEARFHILGDEQESIVRLEPLDFVERDGVLYQVMQVQHEIAGATWDVSVRLSGTTADLTTLEPVLPV